MPGYWDLAAQYPGIVQNAGNSIAQAFIAARQSSAQARQLEYQKQKDERAALLDEAQIAAKQEQGRLEAERQAQKDAADRAAAEAKRNAYVIRATANLPPEQAQAVRARYNITEQDPAMLDAQAASVLGYEAPKDQAGPTDARLYEWAHDSSVSEAERSRRISWLDRRAKAKAQTLTINNDLTPSSKTKVQGEVMNADQRLRQLDQIGAEIEAAGGHDEISSLIESGKATVGGAASRLWSGALSQEDRDKYGARAGAIAAMANFSNDIIKDLSGAAVNAHEWVRLRRSVPLPEDPGYVREEKMRIWRDNYAMIRAAGYQNLQEGINAMQSQLKSYSPSRKSEAATAPQGTGSRDQEEIYNTLVSQGVDEDEAYRRAVEGE